MSRRFATSPRPRPKWSMGSVTRAERYSSSCTRSSSAYSDPDGSRRQVIPGGRVGQRTQLSENFLGKAPRQRRVRLGGGDGIVPQRQPAQHEVVPGLLDLRVSLPAAQQQIHRALIVPPREVALRQIVPHPPAPLRRRQLEGPLIRRETLLVCALLEQRGAVGELGAPAPGRILDAADPEGGLVVPDGLSLGAPRHSGQDEDADNGSRDRKCPAPPYELQHTPQGEQHSHTGKIGRASCRERV